MKNIVALALVSSFAVSLCAASEADARPHWKTRVNHRQTRQDGRLYNGVDNGSLTRREYRGLQKRESHIAAQEARFRRSGSGLSKTEAAKLEREQDRLSHRIYNQKHDEQIRNQ